VKYETLKEQAGCKGERLRPSLDG